jgi:two-component system, OmpR family, phosphate regulon response regulator PhoB
VYGLAVSTELARVLLVEDEPDVRAVVAKILAEEGYSVATAEDALEAMGRLGELDPHLILLDLNLPDISGMDLLARIRRTSNVPVILLTGRAGEGDRIDGLRAGADDYVVKPFSAGELVARIESVLRRANGAVQVPGAGGTLSFDGLEIGVTTREVHAGGRRLDLTAREFDLLVFLARSPRQVFTREQLLQHVWDSSTEWQDSATVTEHVRRIRHKLEAEPDQPRWVLTVRGVGYKFEP